MAIGRTPDPMARRSWSTLSGWRQPAMTFQPSAAYWRTNSRPMPRLALVTTTVGMRAVLPSCFARDEIARGRRLDSPDGLR